ncbi:MAG: serine/threonine-protein kinase [Planctomycetota bacterium]
MEPSSLDDAELDFVLNAAYRGGPRAGSVDFGAPELQRFEVQRSLGRGGMGEVFVARDRVLERRVALKTILPELRFRDETRARFLREARILSQFEHPNLCRLYDYIQSESADVLVLELIEGDTLHDRIRAGLERRDVLHIAEGVATALALAHGAGVVHRDLKPANVMITRDGTPKVLDFGIARAGAGEEPGEQELEEGGRPASLAERLAARRRAQPVTVAGQVIGTPKYMSPEQLRGETASAAGDLYSLGLMLYEMSSGAELPSNVLPAGEAPAAARAGGLQPLIQGLTSPQAAERPSAAEVQLALRRLIGRPRRRAVQLAVVAVLLAFGFLGYRYVRYLGRERDRVVERQRQAERLIGFLVGDVAERVEDVGPPELLEELDRQAIDYFRNRSIDQLSEVELRRRIQAVTGVAQRVSDHGRLAAALRIYRDEARFLEERLADEPGAVEWMFELGQIEFYIGALLRDQHDPDGVRAHWGAYERLSRELVALRPDDVTYRDELAYARTNLGVLHLEEQRPREAYDAFSEALSHWQARLADAPDDGALVLEVVDMLDWRAESLVALGDEAAAERDFGRSLELRTAQVERDPENATFRHGLALAAFHHAQSLRRLGEPERALAPLERAGELGLWLLSRDPERGAWARSQALFENARATLLDELRRFDAARPLHEAACRRAAGLVERDPRNEDWRQLALICELDWLFNTAWRGETGGVVADARALLSWVEEGRSTGGRALALEVEALLLIGDLSPQDGEPWRLAAARLEAARAAAAALGDAEDERRRAVLDARVRLRTEGRDAALRAAPEPMPWQLALDLERHAGGRQR